MIKICFLVVGGLAGFALMWTYDLLLSWTLPKQMALTMNRAILIAALRHTACLAVAFAIAAAFSLGFFHLSGYERGTAESKTFLVGITIAVLIAMKAPLKKSRSA